MTDTSQASGDAVLRGLSDAAVIAVIRAPDRARALRGVEALLAGGVTGIEITYSTPSAVEVIDEVIRRHGDEAIVGAGTVLTPEQAQAAADAGAEFLVSPGSRPDLAAAMLGTGRVVLLGAFTPSEVMDVVERGTHAVKVFPASLGGVAYLRALRAPFPDVPLVPTGGVSASNVGEWLAAGALAVGAGGELCSSAALAADRYEDITARASMFSGAVREWRSK
jgi:2-dehydro-3-deoxyphosphogluconate aldolase/(4S)-4-hydroxy-2-oxoglutarate aldolase